MGDGGGEYGGRLRGTGRRETGRQGGGGGEEGEGHSSTRTWDLQLEEG